MTWTITHREFEADRLLRCIRLLDPGEGVDFMAGGVIYEVIRWPEGTWYCRVAAPSVETEFRSDKAPDVSRDDVFDHRVVMDWPDGPRIRIGSDDFRDVRCWRWDEGVGRGWKVVGDKWTLHPAGRPCAMVEAALAYGSLDPELEVILATRQSPWDLAAIAHGGWFEELATNIVQGGIPTIPAPVEGGDWVVDGRVIARWFGGAEE